jgi:hypothetical protein
MKTWSVIYYGHTITSANYLLDFSEGFGELTAELRPGKYSFNDLGLEIKRALDEAGVFTYSVVINRATQSYTISATGTFSLLVTTGTHIGSSPFSLMGFTGADRTGASTYTGETSGSTYYPQFKLQNYVGSEDLRTSIDASINEAASGELEIVTYGLKKRVEFNLRFITNIPMDGVIVKNNPTGLEEARLLMQYLITKAPIEIMYDIADTNTFETLILDSNTEDSKGTAYRLRELYDRGLPDIFETGVMKFRVIE